MNCPIMPCHSHGSWGKIKEGRWTIYIIPKYRYFILYYTMPQPMPKLFFVYKVFLFDKEPMSNLTQHHVHNIKWSPKITQECMLYRFKWCSSRSHDKKSSMANYFNEFRSHFKCNFISLTLMLNSKLSCNALWA